MVSTDIRNLARESPRMPSGSRISSRRSRTRIVFVRRDLEEISAAAAAEVEKNKAITKDLETTAEDMVIVLDGNRQILQGSDMIMRNVEEAKRGVEQISAAAKQAGQAAIEAQQAGREQSKVPRSSLRRSRRSPPSPTSCRTRTKRFRPRGGRESASPSQSRLAASS